LCKTQFAILFFYLSVSSCETHNLQSCFLLIDIILHKAQFAILFFYFSVSSHVT